MNPPNFGTFEWRTTTLSGVHNDRPVLFKSLLAEIRPPRYPKAERHHIPIGGLGSRRKIVQNPYKRFDPLTYKTCHTANHGRPRTPGVASVINSRYCNWAPALPVIAIGPQTSRKSPGHLNFQKFHLGPKLLEITIRPLNFQKFHLGPKLP
ncbi:hypothetical protein VNO77_02531 [Canavalia gladiata]|uniref:Uncharacterized protein n=1 Tax=Canavalia gladiata TaxID=3824 RepID=A0AAN9R7B6_CANGL